MNIPIVLLHQSAKIPTKNRSNDAGWDLYSPTYNYLEAGKHCSISLGFALEIPDKWYVQIQGRSGLARTGIGILGGVIDASYRGEVTVVLVNNSDSHLEIDVGDRIAQMVFLPVPDIVFTQVKELSSSDRGSNGFGSSGR